MGSNQPSIRVFASRGRRLKQVALPLIILAALLGLLAASLRIIATNYAETDGLILPNGREVGGDFLSFYIAGHIFESTPQQLYNFDFQLKEQRSLFAPRNFIPGSLPFIYPPLLAYFFSVFAHLTLLQSFLIWAVLSMTFFALSAILVVSELKLSPQTACIMVIGGLAFQPFLIECIAGGQTSCLGLLIFALIYRLTSTNRDFLAGIVLGFGYYKPPLFLCFAVIALFKGKFRLIAGALLSGAILIFASVMVVGWDGFLFYIQQALSYTYGEELTSGVTLPTTKGVGLLAFLVELFPSDIDIARISLIVLTVMLILIAVRFAPLDQRLETALDISLSLFLSLQMVIYDLTMLLIPFALVLSYTRENACKANIVIYLLILGFFSEFLLRRISFGSLTFNTVTLVFSAWILALICLSMCALSPAQFLGRSTLRNNT